MKKTNANQIIIVASTIIFSLICGMISKDILIGVPLLITGILCSYYACIGKKINFLFGFINFILIAYMSFINHLYGTVTFYTLFSIPMQIIGYLSWNKNQKDDNTVEKRGFTTKISLIVISSCLIGSITLGLLLSLIPKQELSFLDATSNIVNICSIILFNLRYKESWILLLANNVTDQIIWTINLINKGQSALMMFLTSAAYLLLNIYGIIKWYKTKDSQLQE